MIGFWLPELSSNQRSKSTSQTCRAGACSRHNCDIMYQHSVAMRRIASLSLTCETRQFRKAKPPNIVSYPRYARRFLHPRWRWVDQVKRAKQKAGRLTCFCFGSPCWTLAASCKQAAQSFAMRNSSNLCYTRNKKRKRSATSAPLLFLAPPAGLEPATSCDQQSHRKR